jgi:hypothetical protein
MKETLRRIFLREKKREDLPPPAPAGHLVIRKEGMAERCEICHQSDQLDPATGDCRRCSSIAIPQTIATPLPPPAPPAEYVSTRWKLALTCIVLIAASFAYRMLVFGHLEQTSALFIGLPGFIAALLSLTPKAKSNTGMIMKGMTIALLMSGIFLGEGFICILMASPIFYMVGVIIGLIMDYSARREREGGTRKNKYWQYALLLPFLLMSLEGVTDKLSFSRAEIITEERIVAASDAAVEQSLSDTPRFATELPFYLKLRFPRPVETSGSGLAIGDQRRIHFAGGEGKPGDLIMAVTEHQAGLVRFRVIEDHSKIAHWLDWQEAEVRYQAIDAHHTRVIWTLRYLRRLDPAWYFGPWERYAVRLSADYLIDNVATPRH